MSEWYSKYPNDDGEYEITFKSKNKDLIKAIEKVCKAIMDGVVKSRDDVDFLVRGRWIDNGIQGSALSGCSVCGFTCGAYTFNYCPNCGARMD